MPTVTDELLRGEVLYRDIFIQYGPIPLKIYQLVATLIGNTARTYDAFNWMLAALNGLLLAVRIQTSCGSGWGSRLLIILTVLPAVWASKNTSPWHNSEMLIMQLIVANWQPLDKRCAGRSAFIGALLALQQLSKFGGNLLLGMVMVCFDALTVISGRSRPQGFLAHNMITLAGYLLVLLLWTAYAMISTPASFVLDQLWPLYAHAHYETFDAAARAMPWMGWKVFAAHEFPLLLGVALPFAMLALSASPRHIDVKGLLLPVWCFVAVLFYLPTRWHFYGYSVIALTGWSTIGKVRHQTARLVVSVLLLPAIWVPLKALGPGVGGSDEVPLRTPNGEVLWGTRGEVEGFDALFQALRNGCGSARPFCQLLVIGRGPGLFHFAGMRVAGRHAWFMEKMVRPDEEQELALRASQASVVVFVLRGMDRGNSGSIALRDFGFDPYLPARYLPFEERALRDALAQSMLTPPSLIGNRFAVYTVRRPPSTEQTTALPSVPR